MERFFIILLIEEDIVVVFGQNLFRGERVGAQFFIRHFTALLDARRKHVYPFVFVGAQSEVLASQAVFAVSILRETSVGYSESFAAIVGSQLADCAFIPHSIL